MFLLWVLRNFHCHIITAFAGFRNNVLGGAISLRRAYAYSLYNFVYASLVFALVQFVYFRFVDNGGFGGLLTDTAHSDTMVVLVHDAELLSGSAGKSADSIGMPQKTIDNT